MQRLGVSATPPVNQGWGTLTEVVLPGSGKLSVYETHHARPEVSRSGPAAKKKAPTKEGPEKETSQVIRQKGGPKTTKKAKKQ
jgi:hypothetical protein